MRFVVMSNVFLKYVALAFIEHRKPIKLVVVQNVFNKPVFSRCLKIETTSIVMVKDVTDESIVVSVVQQRKGVVNVMVDVVFLEQVVLRLLVHTEAKNHVVMNVVLANLIRRGLTRNQESSHAVVV